MYMPVCIHAIQQHLLYARTHVWIHVVVVRREGPPAHRKEVMVQRLPVSARGKLFYNHYSDRVLKFVLASLPVANLSERHGSLGNL